MWSNVRTSERSGGFTLIELLIVVAIIAILASIAVPNFLEAQVRAKISRAKSDMRAMATGIESFRANNKDYPPGDLNKHGLPSITTPVAYMTTLPIDPFSPIEEWYKYSPYYYYFATKPDRDKWEQFSADFLVNTLKFPGTDSGWSSAQSSKQYVLARWQVRTFGPDLADNHAMPYDTTNGTKSSGDITLFGPSCPGLF